jgi:hypothetical protein
MRRTLVIHPFLFALWPILFIYSQNLEYISFSQAWNSLLVLLGLTLLLFLLFTAILRKPMKAGAVVSLLLVLFFSYAHVHRLLWKEFAEYSAAKESLVLMFVWAALFLGGAALIIKVMDGWQNITKILNAVALTLILISLFNIGAYELKAKTRRLDARDKPFEIAQTDPVQVDTLPNIYYIILDEYGRADILEEVYDYDNSEFLDFLEQKGFFIADKSHTNYAQTDLALASSLNLSYLDDLAARVGLEFNDRQPLEHMIQNNTVVQFLKKNGYTIVALPSGYSATTLKDSDVYTDSEQPWNELEIRLLTSTPMPWLAVQGSFFDLYDVHRHKILESFDLLADTTQSPGPRFVFAHILAPHGPFVFDEHGNEIQPKQQFDLQAGPVDFDSDEYRKGYIGQLIFTNDKVKSILNNLLAESSRPTIIILQADHGPASLLDWDEPTNTQFKERLAILNAYLLPGDGTASLYDEITPVNTFRLIFNEYFGTDLEQLEDESYFSTRERPYEFINVTDAVRPGSSQ